LTDYINKLSEKLTDRQQAFCMEYIVDFNATQSCIRAGYSSKGASVQGSKLLANTNVASYIDALKKYRAESVGAKAESVIEEVRRMAFIRECDFYHNDGSPKRLDELTEEQRSALSLYTIKSVKNKDGEHEDVPVFKVHDKLRALELLSKYLGMLNESKTTINNTNVNTNTLNAIEIKFV